MSARLLPPAEWDALGQAPIRSLLAMLDPDAAEVVVVERGGAVVACCTLLTLRHLEGLWVEPGSRQSAGVGRLLLEAVYALLERSGDMVFAATDNPGVKKWLGKMGAMPLPYTLETESYVLTRRER